MQSERVPVGRKPVPVVATDCDFAVAEVAVEAVVVAGSAKEAAAGVLTLATAVAAVVVAAAEAVPVVAVAVAAVAAVVVASTVPAVPVPVLVVVMVRNRTIDALLEVVLVAVVIAAGVPLLALRCLEGPVWGWCNMTPPDRRLVVAMGRTAQAVAMDTVV